MSEQIVATLAVSAAAMAQVLAFYIQAWMASRTKKELEHRLKELESRTWSIEKELKFGQSRWELESADDGESQ